MELDINIEKLKDFFRWSNLRKVIFDFLARWAKLSVFLLAVLGTAYCVYLWYVFIYRPGWSDDQKEQYLKTKGQGIVFDQAKFNALTKTAKDRAAAESQPPQNIPDIFRLKSLILPPGASDSGTASAASPPVTKSSAAASGSAAAPVAKMPAVSPPAATSSSGN